MKAATSQTFSSASHHFFKIVVTDPLRERKIVGVSVSVSQNVSTLCCRQYVKRCTTTPHHFTHFVFFDEFVLFLFQYMTL